LGGPVFKEVKEKDFVMDFAFYFGVCEKLRQKIA
jgi:hypothetical protein